MNAVNTNINTFFVLILSYHLTKTSGSDRDNLDSSLTHALPL